ncbi:MAG: sugar transferase [Bacteroidales bacterium]|nr:sugar transferase [Bacteroidales bacterium]
MFDRFRFLIVFIKCVNTFPTTCFTFSFLASHKGAGVSFLQERPGKDKKIFIVIKFKFMTAEHDAEVVNML